jgi:hypothetical protein
LDGGTEIYSEPNTAAYLATGTHLWQWDGYGTDGVLDTKVLKSKSLVVRLTATQNGKTQVRELKLNNKADKVEWVDAKIDRNAKEVQITFRPGFEYGGTLRDELHGYDSNKPIPGYRAKSFDELMIMAKKGFEKYWTRDSSRNYTSTSGVNTVINPPISTTKGIYAVKIKLEPNVEPKINGVFPLYDVLETGYDTIKKDYSLTRRATSAPGFKAIYHLAGFYYDAYRNINYAEEDFEETAAHELGHLILLEYGSYKYSWSHDNSSTISTQKPLEGSVHNYPTGTPTAINIMHYFNTPKSIPSHWNRVSADEKDVKGLIWLCRVEFK